MDRTRFTGTCYRAANSHRPPSTDGYSKPAPQNLRKPSRRKSGGQNGHPGATLQTVATPDRVVVHRLNLCPCGCGANLRKRPLLRYKTRTE